MASSHSGSGKALFVMPEEMRSRLGAPIGKLVTSREELASEVSDSDYIVTVGDVVTLDMLEAGIFPDICIVDYMTKRMPMAEVKSRFSNFPQPEIRVSNPASQITEELWEAIKDGYRNPRHLRIVVDGEEDLASLACIFLAPDNTTVIYGIPNRGASVHHVDAKLKQLVKDVLDRMEA